MKFPSNCSKAAAEIENGRVRLLEVHQADGPIGPAMTSTGYIVEYLKCDGESDGFENALSKGKLYTFCDEFTKEGKPDKKVVEAFGPKNKCFFITVCNF